MWKTRRARPLARSGDLLLEQVGPETVVYDTQTKQAHCLAPLAASVFAGSDGRSSVSELADRASERLGEPVDGEQVEDALSQLGERGLLAVSVTPGISRRELVRKTALAGGAAVATTLITTVVAPGAAQAAACGGSCSPSNTSACDNRSCSGGQSCQCLKPGSNGNCTGEDTGCTCRCK